MTIGDWFKGMFGTPAVRRIPAVTIDGCLLCVAHDWHSTIVGPTCHDREHLLSYCQFEADGLEWAMTAHGAQQKVCVSVFVRDEAWKYDAWVSRWGWGSRTDVEFALDGGGTIKCTGAQLRTEGRR